MLRKTTALLAAATLVMGAAPAAKQPASKSVAVKPPAAKPAPTGAFDARNPSNLIEVLAAADAKAEIVKAEAGGVILKVTSPAGAFQAQFAGCDEHGRACAALQFDAASEKRTATLAEINRFNQSSLTCRMIQDQTGKPHVLYSTLVFAADSRAETVGQIDAWRGCIAAFGDFIKDPNGYLASVP